ncbi:MAG: hypothetical protein JNK82_39180 [Myxococcaceae bacterium]|nr:hypothetical protein [Myxococcaceae bacterium]
MIVKHNLNWRLILRQNWRALVFIVVVGLASTVLELQWPQEKELLPPTAVGALSAALAIFLAFRNSAGYDRWWEARKQWGSLINSTRSFARQLATLGAAKPEVQRAMLYRQIAFAHALRLQLRGQQKELKETLAPFVEASELERIAGSTNAAMWLLQNQGAAVKALELEPIRHARLDETLSALTDVQGACERLKTTPVPRQYEYFPRLFLYVYAVLLPLALAAHLEWFTVCVTVPVSFLFMALERVGEVMETPFENRVTDVPLSAMCRTIERNLRELAGDTEKLPPPLEPIDGYLW